MFLWLLKAFKVFFSFTFVTFSILTFMFFFNLNVSLEGALYALNKIRSLHGLKDLVWNDELEKQAKEWALQLAEDQLSTELSGVDSLGEIVYVAKGTSECTPMNSAILEW